MDPQLHQIIQALKSEKCPARVQEKVRFRITGEPSTGSPLFWLKVAIPLGIFAFAVSVFMSFPWQDNSAPQSNHQVFPIAPDLESREVAQATVLSLTYTGKIILESGIEAQHQLKKSVKPPLHSSYREIQTLFNSTTTQ